MPKVADLIAALPTEEAAECEELALPEERLEELLADLSQRRVPVHSLHRLWALGGLQAQIALAYFAYWVREWFLDSAEAKRLLVETNLRVGLGILRRMVYLRGAVMKIGQTLGSFPDIVPDQIVETLGRLHSEVPPMHFSLLREQVRNELGGDPEELFDSFETEAFAAASLGQVHRARLRTGERIAVKVQYPGIARAIDGDFRNLKAFLFPLRLGKDWQNVQDHFEEIRAMLLREADYRQEAEFLLRGRALFHPDEGIVVPRVFERWSTRRVLTMEYLDGVHVRDFLARKPSQTERDEFGRKMYLAAFRMYYARMNYADPHPGNYLFMDDGRLGLIDFGCVQTYSDAEWEILLLGLPAAGGDPEAFREMVRRTCDLTDEELEDGERMKALGESFDWVVAPLRTGGPFDFGDEQHLRKGMEVLSRLVVKRYTRSHPVTLYLQRSFFGLRAMLYRLRARVDVKAIADRELPAAS